MEERKLSVAPNARFATTFIGATSKPWFIKYNFAHRIVTWSITADRTFLSSNPGHSSPISHSLFLLLADYPWTHCSFFHPLAPRMNTARILASINYFSPFLFRYQNNFLRVGDWDRDFDDTNRTKIRDGVKKQQAIGLNFENDSESKNEERVFMEGK